MLKCRLYLLYVISIQGILFPDGAPHPSVHECKYLQQPAALAPANNTSIIKVKTGEDTSNFCMELQLKQRNSFFPLGSLEWEWSIVSDMLTPLSRGSFKVHQEKAMITMKLDRLLTRPCWLNIAGCINHDTKWCRKGHVIVTEQLVVEVETSSNSSAISLQRSEPSILHPIATDESGSKLSISTSLQQVIFEKESGLLSEFRMPALKNIFVKAITPNLTRAETDNDRGGVEIVRSFFDWPVIIDFAFWKGKLEKSLGIKGIVDLNRSFSFQWRASGLSASNPPCIKCLHFESCTRDDHSATDVRTKSLISSAGAKQGIATVSTHYEINSDGRMDATFLIEPGKRLHSVLSLPRIGVAFALCPSFYHISYFGRGDFENYPDRKCSARVGLYETTPSKMHVNYIVPGENGNRTDCRWVCFLDDDGSGLMIASNEGLFCFSASLWSQGELHNARHTSDLESRLDNENCVHVNIDHALMGVGGDLGYVLEIMLFL